MKGAIVGPSIQRARKSREANLFNRDELYPRTALASVFPAALGLGMGHVRSVRRPAHGIRRCSDDLPAAGRVFGDVRSVLWQLSHAGGPAFAAHIGRSVKRDFAPPVHIRLVGWDCAGPGRVLFVLGLHRQLAARTLRLQRGRNVVWSAGAVDRLPADGVADAVAIDVHASAVCSDRRWHIGRHSGAARIAWRCILKIRDPGPWITGTADQSGLQPKLARESWHGFLGMD